MFPIENPFLFFLGAFFAEVVGTLGGFGSATILTVIAALFLNLKVAIVFVAIFHLAGSLARGAYFRGDIRWDVFLKFIAPDLAFTALGAFAVAAAPEGTVRLAFGAFLVVYGLAGFAWPGRMRLPGRTLVLYAGGGLSGFLAGLLGTGGAARAMTLQAFGLPRNEYLATSAILGIVTDTLRLGVYLWLGLVLWTKAEANLAVWLVAVAVLGALAGSRIVEKVPERSFSLIVYALLALAGINFIFG